MDTKHTPTWDELLAIMNDSTQRPDEIGWNIYRYLSANFTNMASEEVRTLLLCYLKLPTTKPSLLHSCILALAIKIAKQFSDFRFAPFIGFWGYKFLRNEDLQPSVGKDGKSYPSLLQKVTQMYLHSRIVMPAQDCDDNFRAIIMREAERMGYLTPIQMVAVKTFVTEANGRKIRSIKLIGTKGEEMIADWHTFNCKPWEIIGHVYNVLPRKAKDSGNIRVADITLSQMNVGDVFGKVIGFVDRYDQSHDHWHIFDAQSRHFVAEAPSIKPRIGEFVWFAPIIPEKDRFKSAIIIATEEHAKAQEAFGIQQATIDYINSKKDFFRYTINDVTESDETIAKEGFGTTSALFSTPPSVGDKIRIIVYLRRGKDGKKRNHIAEIIK